MLVSPASVPTGLPSHDKEDGAPPQKLPDQTQLSEPAAVNPTDVPASDLAAEVRHHYEKLLEVFCPHLLAGLASYQAPPVFVSLGKHPWP